MTATNTTSSDPAYHNATPAELIGYAWDELGGDIVVFDFDTSDSGGFIEIVTAAMTTEHWMPVPGYEGIYEVSDHGCVGQFDSGDQQGRRVPARSAAQRTRQPAVTKGYDSFPVARWARTARAPTPDHLAGQQVEVDRLAGEGLPGGHLAAL